MSLIKPQEMIQTVLLVVVGVLFIPLISSIPDDLKSDVPFKQRQFRYSRFSGSTHYPTHMIPPCDSKVFCHGKFLENNYLSKVFPNELEFLHLKLRNNPDFVLNEYERIFLNSTNFESRYISFINQYFELIPIVEQFIPQVGRKVNVSSDSDLWIPDDWDPEPDFIGKIQNDQLRDWAKQLHTEWLTLARKVSINVRYKQNRYTLLYMPHGYFTSSTNGPSEMRYFDTYLIFRAMLLAKMNQTAKDLINNLLSLKEKNLRFNLIPNGNRVYYLGYSSPPLIVLMVYEYWKATNDSKFMISTLVQLEDDLKYWKRQSRSIPFNRRGKILTLHIYNVLANTPRPFAYFGDYELGEELQSNLSEFYTNVGSMTESAWDPSSRWIRNSKSINSITIDRDLKSIEETRIIDIIPVDLNAIICLNHRLLDEMYLEANSTHQAIPHQREYVGMVNAMKELWNDKLGTWTDLNHRNETLSNQWYASNLMPLFTGCFTYGIERKKGYEMESILEYFQNEKFDNFESVIPLSKIESGFQWDMPYNHPFYMMTMIEGFSNSESKSAQKLAQKIAQTWIYRLREKWDDKDRSSIDATENAAILLLLQRYGDILKPRGPTSMAMSKFPYFGNITNTNQYHILLCIIIPFLIINFYLPSMFTFTL